VRALGETSPGAFDVALSCDNSPPHRFTAQAAPLAARRMATKPRRGGPTIGGIRDGDQLLTERSRAMTPRSHESGVRSVWFQVWDWSPDTERSMPHHFLLLEAERVWETRYAASEERPPLRADRAAALREAGPVDTQWHEPEATGHHRPLVTANRPWAARRAHRRMAYINALAQRLTVHGTSDYYSSKREECLWPASSC